MKAEPELKFERAGPVAVITLNRPSKLNALNRQIMTALDALFSRELAAYPDIRCVVITGAGERAFSAGADVLEKSPELSITDSIAAHVDVHRVFNAIEAFSRPVITALNGLTLGGGLELALCADVRFAVTTARLGLTEVKLGILPGAGGTQRLPRLIGPSKAKDMIFTGRMVEANEAHAMGLVDQLCAPDKLMDEALAYAHQIARHAPLPIIHAKRAINWGMQTTLEAGLEYERHAAAIVVKSEDAAEGIRAFAEKRPPRFTGR